MIRSIDKIILHCAATPNGKPFSAADIDRWHDDRGFRRREDWVRKYQPNLGAIGYHYVIGLKGNIEPGRHEQEEGAHTFGHNRRSIGVCLIGTNRFTLAQWIALKNLTSQLCARYTEASIHGHREFANKDCPGFDVQRWVASGFRVQDWQIIES